MNEKPLQGVNLAGVECRTAMSFATGFEGCGRE